MPNILSCLSIFDCSSCIAYCFLSRYSSTIWVDLVPMEHCALLLGTWMNPYCILQLYIIWGPFKSNLNSHRNLIWKNNEFYNLWKQRYQSTGLFHSVLLSLESIASPLWFQALSTFLFLLTFLASPDCTLYVWMPGNGFRSIETKSSNF